MINEVHFGDCRDSLRKMHAAGITVQTCITSPPYFGLRDYGHAGQIGLEETPEQFIAELVEVFRCVRDVLADDGTLWVNIGDSYASTGGHGGIGANSQRAGRTNVDVQNARKGYAGGDGIKTKDLIGIPWMLAFALRADGWYLRQDIIWHKPNPMPESVTDRCTKAHEYVFLLSKSPRYFMDPEGMREDAVKGAAGSSFNKGKTAGHQLGRSSEAERVEDGKRNRRSVWTISTRPYKGAHFAVFPSALVEPCILAGSRPAGKRCDCATIIGSPTGAVAEVDPSMNVGRAGMSRPRGELEGTRPITRREQRHHAIEMKASPYRAEMEARSGAAFAHYIRTDPSGARPLPESLRLEFAATGWITDAPPCDCPEQPADVVLDPFMGSGTTAAVAIEHGRQFIGCELNIDYKPLQDARIASAWTGGLL